MTLPPRFEWQQSAKRGRGTIAKWILAATALLIAFGVGVALGEALHDNPNPNGSVTFVTTLNPATP